MEGNENTVKLYYNTELAPLAMPEYGRNIYKMVCHLREIEDRDKRSRQAAAVVKVMELLNPQVHSQENYEQKLWDHLFMIAGYDLDIDSPYPVPAPERLQTAPEKIPLNKRPIKANHYGRNIESIIDLVAEQTDSEVKTAMIRALAIYMRQQYLIWNKDSVADETIFKDIERLSDYRIKVPEGIDLGKVTADTLARPSLNLNMGGGKNRNNRRNSKKKKQQQ